MAKRSTIYVCQGCGAKAAKWAGKCSECGAWNSLVEEHVSHGAEKGAAKVRDAMPNIQPLLEGAAASEINQLKKRLRSGFSEFDRVLGGGFLNGSLLLFGGEPGIGKSTLLLQVLSNLALQNTKCLYLSAEESVHQVGQRAERLKLKGAEKLSFLGTTDFSEALAAVSTEKPQVLVVDSVQTLGSPEIESAPGTVSQIREITHQLMKLAKSAGITVLLVGHVTKEGSVAGPKLLEHMVDGVFYFELASSSGYRLLRGQKNRFGSTNEVAVFEMGQLGLEQIENPSERFLAERVAGLSGSSIVAHMEGSRPFLTEFQALTSRCYQGYPRRTFQGVDHNRMSVLVAIAEKVMGENFSDQDLFCKVASGHRVEEPAADLAMLMALVSARRGQALPSDLLFLGEVGLGGELRSIPALEARLAEAKNVGVKRVVVPRWHERELAKGFGLKLLSCRDVKEAAALAFTRGAVSKGPEADDLNF